MKSFLLTIEDLPSDRASCWNCTRKGGVCPRAGKRFPNGYVMNSVTGDVGGIVTLCPHYTGVYERKGQEI